MVTLTNVGSAYDAIPASQGLGMAEVDFTGVTQVVFRVRVQKIGTGVQDWQLFDETDSTQIAVLSDSAAAAVRTLGPTTINVSKTGIHLIRVRAKSSVAADDPVFLGCTVRLVR